MGLPSKDVEVDRTGYASTQELAFDAFAKVPLYFGEASTIFFQTGVLGLGTVRHESAPILAQKKHGNKKKGVSSLQSTPHVLISNVRVDQVAVEKVDEVSPGLICAMREAGHKMLNAAIATM